MPVKLPKLPIEQSRCPEWEAIAPRSRQYIVLMSADPLSPHRERFDRSVSVCYNLSAQLSERGVPYDGAVRVGILTASSEGYDIHRRLGFQDYCQVNVYLGPMDVKSNEEETS